MNSKQRREYWKKVERMRLKLERKYKPKVQKALEVQISSFTKAYEQDPDGAVGSLRSTPWDDALMSVYTDMFRETYMLFAEATYQSVRKQALKLRMMGRDDTWISEVKRWILLHGLQLVSTITGNSKSLILRIISDTLQEGVSEGLGTFETTQRIISRLNDPEWTKTPYRAERIVRTETARAANEGTMAGARSLPFVVEKVWISALDERTRVVPKDAYDHVAMDGQHADLDNAFISTSREGATVVAMQPGDVTAPAGFTINCRCAVAFEPKRDSNDRLILKQ